MSTETVLKMNHVNVGMFNLPGIHFDHTYNFSPEMIAEMEQWAEENNCGMKMTDSLWAFKNDEHKQWFIMRWCTELNHARIKDE